MARIFLPFSKAYYKGPLSDHFDGFHFFNPWLRRSHSFMRFLRWRSSTVPKPWPKRVKVHINEASPVRIDDHRLRVCFVGHSTVLLQTCGLNILTDPVWSRRAGPISWMGPKRVCDPGIRFDQLPKIDLVLVSHNHYDHLDRRTLHKLWERDKPKIIAPLGNDSIIRLRHPSVVVETMDWHQAKKINDAVTVHLEPAQHWSARGFLDVDKALWGAFVIDTPGGKIYFAGDTGYGGGEHFRKVQEKFGKIRFAMLPIGAYEPRWFMNYAHMNPHDAILAHKDLGEPYTMGIHFGTFRLADEGYEGPLRALEKAQQDLGIHRGSFRGLKIGEAWEIPELV